MSKRNDSCCNDECNQGRECPARVAKVGKRFPAQPIPLRPTNWRNHMQDLVSSILLVILAMLVAAFLFPVFF